MEFVSDVFLAAGAFGAGLYCLVLSRRLRAFMQLEKGVGGAIAALSAQVDGMTRAVNEARGSAAETTRRLDEVVARAAVASQRLERLLAGVDDLPFRSSVPSPALVPETAPAPAVASEVAAPRPAQEAQPETGFRRLRFVRRKARGRAAMAA